MEFGQWARLRQLFHALRRRRLLGRRRYVPKRRHSSTTSVLKRLPVRVMRWVKGFGSGESGHASRAFTILRGPGHIPHRRGPTATVQKVIYVKFLGSEILLRSGELRYTWSGRGRQSRRPNVFDRLLISPTTPNSKLRAPILVTLFRLGELFDASPCTSTISFELRSTTN